MSNTQEMPVEEAVKVIGGTQAGSAPVSEGPTAGKALDAVPVGPDPAATDDTPQDGDYFLDANLADSMQVVWLSLSSLTSNRLCLSDSVHLSAAVMHGQSPLVLLLKGCVARSSVSACPVCWASGFVHMD